MFSFHIVKRLTIPKNVRQFASIFHRNSYRLYIVGGAVRDHLLGIPITDYDFSTDATPDEVMSLFRHVIPTGVAHGTVTVIFKGEHYEVTTFRTEFGYSDSRHPDSITFVTDFDQDLSRRDFTVNALAADTVTGRIIDMHDGIADLRRGVLRAIGDPETRFAEDSLRILRGYRFISTLQFTFEEATKQAAIRLAHTISQVSQERIREELNKMLQAKKPSLGLFALHDHGVLPHILPELSACAGIGQKGIHAFDVLTHSIISCDGAPKDNLIVRWAALLHDIGKPKSLSHDAQGLPTFHRHEHYSAELADTILSRLKFSNRERQAIVHLIRNHMFHYTPDWSDAAVRRFIARVGLDAIHDLFLLREADSYGASGTWERNEKNKELMQRIESCLEAESAFTIKDLAVNGSDLISAGIPQGVIIGRILQELLETVLDDPAQNSKEQLLKLSLNLYKKYS